MQPIVKPLPYWRRKLVFGLLLAIFLLSLPVFMFYATGYRYDFLGETPSITSTGGLYISANEADGAIYVDETEVEDARVFRKAAYIQGLEPGLHRVHVQIDGLNTWVKNLMVYSQIVTEAEVFNLPVVPQVRLITEYVTTDSEPVVFVDSLMSEFTIDASTTLQAVVTNKVATSSYKMNSEFILLNELFEGKASTTVLLKKQKEEIEKNRFTFATTSEVVVAGELATTTIMKDDLMLYEAEGDIFVRALGVGKHRPHYFCAEQQLSTTSATYEGLSANAVESLEDLQASNSEVIEDGHSCRTDIRIDRKWQTVHDFAFYPDNTNLILMNLYDGIYVVEVDDRSWQNVQLLYPGTDLETLVHGGSIYIKDGDLIMETLTELISK
jgi:hypothetical protein